MRIGELADSVGVTAKTIRYYESIGLLAEPARTPSGYREYADSDLERLRFVKDAQSAGLSLAEVASVLELKGAGAGSCAHTRRLIEAKLDEIDAQLETLKSTRSALAELAARASTLDPAECTDPNRCQVIFSRSDP